MLLPEIDPIGDMQGVISLQSDIPALELSKKFRFKFSEHLYFTKDEVAEYLYVPVSMRKDFETMIFLNEMKAVEEGGLVIAKISSRDHPEMEIFRGLINIPSVVLDYKLLDGGVHKTYFSFHHSHLREVSEFLFEARKKIGPFIPEYLGKSQGFAWLLETQVSTEPMYHLEASLKVPQEELGKEEQVFKGTWLRRPRFSSGDTIADSLYRVHEWNRPDKSGVFEEISEEENIYRALSGSALSKLYTKSLAENFDPLICQYQKFDGEFLTMGGIVSRSYLKTMMSILSSISKRFPEWDLHLLFSHQMCGGAELRRVLGMS